MLTPDKSIDIIVRFFLYVFILSFVIDNLLVIVIGKYRSALQNSYYKLHRQFGILITIILKTILAVYMFHLLLEPGANGIELIAPVIIYTFYVSKMFLDFIESMRR